MDSRIAVAILAIIAWPEVAEQIKINTTTRSSFLEYREPREQRHPKIESRRTLQVQVGMADNGRAFVYDGDEDIFVRFVRQTQGCFSDCLMLIAGRFGVVFLRKLERDMRDTRDDSVMMSLGATVGSLA